MRHWFALVIGVFATGLPLAASGQPTRVGTEFQVNTHTPAAQANPSIAADAAGDFVVVWLSVGQDGSGTGVFGQRFDSSGVSSGTEFQVNTYTPSNQGSNLSSIEVSRGADGSFVVVWPSAGGVGNRIFARRYDNTGAPIGAQFAVSSHTLTTKDSPGVAVEPGGNFVVSWTDASRDASGSGAFARRFNSSGAALGGDFQLSTYTLSSQGLFGPRLAFDADGDFVAVWVSSGQDGSANGLFGRRYDSSGAAQGTEFQINSYTSGIQQLPSVAADPDGNFVVSWWGYHDGSGASVQARRFDSLGAPVGGEFQVNTFTPGAQIPLREAVFVDANGRFVIVWSSDQDGSIAANFGQQFDSSGAPLGTEFMINTYTIDAQVDPVIAGGPSGDFVVAWQSAYQDGDYEGIFAQRFQVGSLATDTPTPTPSETPTAMPTDTNTPTVTPTATPIGACPLTVDGGCTTGFAKGTLLIKEDIAGKEKLVAKMVKGPALAQTDLGNPLSGGGTVYSLCIYDDAGNLAGGIGARWWSIGRAIPAAGSPAGSPSAPTRRAARATSTRTRRSPPTAC